MHRTKRPHSRAALAAPLAAALAASLATFFAGADARASGCTFSSVSAPIFGVYNVFDASPVVTTGSLTYNCVSVGAISVWLGRGGSSTFYSRRMTNGSFSLVYNLFTSASYSAVWGDGSEGTATYTNASPPNGSNVTLTIYGKIPALQNVGVGSYADTIVATINF